MLARATRTRFHMENTARPFFLTFVKSDDGKKLKAVVQSPCSGTVDIDLVPRERLERVIGKFEVSLDEFRRHMAEPLRE